MKELLIEREGLNMQGDSVWIGRGRDFCHGYHLVGYYQRE